MAMTFSTTCPTGPCDMENALPRDLGEIIGQGGDRRASEFSNFPMQKSLIMMD